MTHYLVIGLVSAVCIGFTYLALLRGDRKERP